MYTMSSHIRVVLTRLPRSSIIHAKLPARLSPLTFAAPPLLKSKDSVPHVSLLCHSCKLIHTTVPHAKKKSKKSTKEVEHSDQDTRSLDELIDMEQLKTTFSEILVHLNDDFATKMALRTSHTSFSQLPVDIGSGKTVNLQYIAQVTMKPPNTVHINLVSHPQYISNVRKELQKSSLNVNPRIDGNSIFIETPKVTREHREQMGKAAKVISDQHKVQVREVQNSKLKTLKKFKGAARVDDVRKLEKDILEMGKLFNQQIDSILKQKQKELLSS